MLTNKDKKYLIEGVLQNLEEASDDAGMFDKNEFGQDMRLWNSEDRRAELDRMRKEGKFPSLAAQIANLVQYINNRKNGPKIVNNDIVNKPPGMSHARAVALRREYIGRKNLSRTIQALKDRILTNNY